MSGRRQSGAGNIYVRRERSGARTWYARYTVAGRRQHVALGPVRDEIGKGLTQVQAERELGRRIEQSLREDGSVAIAITIEEAGRDLLASLTALGRKPSTIGSYESMLRVHLAPHFGRHPLATIRRADVESFADRRLRAGSSPKTVRNLLGVLHAVYRHAQRREWVATNPVELAHRPASPRSKDIRFLTLDEIEAVLAQIGSDDPYDQVDRVLVLAAAHTGLRKGELVALRWRDIDRATLRIRVRRSYVRRQFGTPKSARGTRSVPLSTRLAGELERHHQRTLFKADDDLVLAHPLTGGPLPEATITRRFKRHAVAAGVRPDVRFHDLRHTFGTAMAASGVPMRTLQEWMGHRDLQTTLIYADYAASPHETAMLEHALNPQAFPQQGRREGRRATPRSRR